jgi:hypothetical protein
MSISHNSHWAARPVRKPAFGSEPPYKPSWHVFPGGSLCQYSVQVCACFWDNGFPNPLDSLKLILASLMLIFLEGGLVLTRVRDVLHLLARDALKEQKEVRDD